MIRQMAPSERYQYLAVRVTHNEHIDWPTVFGDEFSFSMSCMEASQRGVVHSHSAIVLTKFMPRNTIDSRLKKMYSFLKGNRKISIKEWDLNHDHLNYINKNHDPEAEGHDVGTCVIRGEFLGIKTPLEYFNLFRASPKFNDISKKKKNKSRPYIVDYCISKINNDFKDPTIPSIGIVLGYIFEYYKEFDGDVNGNINQVNQYARKIIFKLNMHSASFKTDWVNMHLARL